jgi:hypothetical protein
MADLKEEQLSSWLTRKIDHLQQAGTGHES